MTKQVDPGTCPTRLLDDLPADSDEFGGHQKIAKALAQLVATEGGGRAVALTGPWGSGKSTIIELTRAELTKISAGNPDEYHVFVFDAWAHSGDPLRRAFLEGLIGELIKCQWLDEGQWTTKELIALSGKQCLVRVYGGGQMSLPHEKGQKQAFSDSVLGLAARFTPGRDEARKEALHQGKTAKEASHPGTIGSD